MNYELAKKLKDAGFPDSDGWGEYDTINGPTFRRDGYGVPTLSELIEACGDDLYAIFNTWAGWGASVDEDTPLNDYYKTPEEAVANLWLKLNEKQ